MQVWEWPASLADDFKFEELNHCGLLEDSSSIKLNSCDVMIKIQLISLFWFLYNEIM